jgi:hypothetical protein
MRYLLNQIIDIIKTVESKNSNINPTIIYNEGWMLRLLIQQSITEQLIVHGLDFSKIKNWTSEALISSPFVFAKVRREGYTHADAALGDFDVDYSKRGEIIVAKNASIFGIIEAKMGSNLSQGTTHAKNYNQASRNITCIAHNTRCNSACEIFFFIAAPQSTIDNHELQEQLNQTTIQIKHRFGAYPEDDSVRDNMDTILYIAAKMRKEVISFEEWLGAIQDQHAKKDLQDFYCKCLKWNKVVSSRDCNGEK